MGLCIPESITYTSHLLYRYDNSGHRMSYPTWQSNQTNIDRTDQVIQTIVSMYSNQPDVVPVIAPLNE